jgi:DNA-binding response OmpR family regulator/DNA-binding CsgD family transcriptional regulator
MRSIVLVVDDSIDELTMISETLESAGTTTLVARDGQSALAIVERVTPDAILMDAVMPGMDGFETCRRLKQKSAIADVPVIFMTGLSDTDHVLQGFDAGGVDYVTKPVVAEEFLARIRTHVANSRRARGATIALDSSGRYLLAADDDARLLWWTPQAGRLVEELLDARPQERAPLPSAISDLIAQQGQSGLPGTTEVNIGPWLQVSYVSRLLPGEHLLRVTRQETVAAPQVLLARALPVSLREAEVLLWLSRGKSNRDIAEILSLSPRTVNKHLEQIFKKIGVENRTAAAGAAIRVLGGARSDG